MDADEQLHGLIEEPVVVVEEVNSAAFRQCITFLQRKGDCPVADFFAWFDRHRTEVDWPKEKHVEEHEEVDYYKIETMHSGCIPYRIALESNVPTAVVVAIRDVTPHLLVCVSYLERLKANGGGDGDGDGDGDTEFLAWLGRMTAKQQVALLTATSVSFKAEDSRGNRRCNGDSNFFCDTENGTLLLLALYHNASETVLLALLEACPDAAKQDALIYYYHHDMFPPGCNAYNDTTLVSVSSVGWDHYDGDAAEGRVLPLHFALRYRAPPAVVSALLAAFPRSVKVKDAVGCTPLHLALRYDSGDPSNDAIILAIQEAWPTAMSTRTPVLRFEQTTDTDGNVREFEAGGETPLHYALRYESSVLHYTPFWDTISKSGPTIKTNDCDGNTPLHYALMYTVPAQSILAVFRLRRTAVKRANVDGKTPLDVALENGDIPAAVTLEILERFPGDLRQSIKSRGEDCEHLVFRAVENTIPQDIIFELLRMYPDAIKKTDYSGNTLLSHMLKHAAPLAVVRRVFEAWPEAASLRSEAHEEVHYNVYEWRENVGGETTLHFAVRAMAASNTSKPLLVNNGAAAASPKASPSPEISLGPPSRGVCSKCGEAVLTTQPRFQNQKIGGNNEYVHQDCDRSAAFLVLAPCGVGQHGMAKLVLDVLAAWPRAAKVKDANGYTPLEIALEKGAGFWASALIAACPGAAKVETTHGSTPLHSAMHNEDTAEPVISALFTAYPGAVKKKNRRGSTPLDFHILPGMPAEVVAEYRRNLPDDGAVCMSYLREGKHLNVDTFVAWLDAHKGKGGWLLTPEMASGGTPLQVALNTKGIPAAVTLAILAACPEAATVKTSWTGRANKHTCGKAPLYLAWYKNASVQVVTALLAAWPGALKEVDRWGCTELHVLSTRNCSTLAECKHACTLCFLMVKYRASLAATNTRGRTPAMAAAAAAAAAACGRRFGTEIANHHLVATFREIALFKKHTHLSWMHFRDWTTVSHAWCTPSAKLVALTVLLVGETYKRGLLPRLPMDCWYRILNKLPRHELRLGECDPAEERTALATYATLLKEARTAIDASDAACHAAAAAATRA